MGDARRRGSFKVRLDEAIKRRAEMDVQQREVLERWWASLSDEERTCELRKRSNAGCKLRLLQTVVSMLGTEVTQ
jgi:hypothetical protein